MSGFGESHRQDGPLAVCVELRSINAKGLKLTTRLPEGYAPLEPRVESTLRSRIRRGTVLCTIRLTRERSADDYRINAVALAAYCRQVKSLAPALPEAGAVSIDALLALPGVVEEQPLVAADSDAVWPLVLATLGDAADRLDQMRAQEGQAMAVDLASNCKSIGESLDTVERLSGGVAESYRSRLWDRVQKVLDQRGMTLDPADLIREVSIYADRCDASEEIVRLRSHLEQFDEIMQSDEEVGRKLEWLTQEMFREANTIGSKAGDVEISRQVIEIKSAVERIREMVQNIQ
jgi:uncharacterized protein (TIGR00255 family)